MRQEANLSISEERTTDGVSLLISILVRFPQIGTIQFESRQRNIWLNFMLAQTVPTKEIREIKKKVTAYLKAYHNITGNKPTCVHVESKQPYEKFCMLTVVRDLASLSKGEIALLISLVMEQFHDSLIIDDPDFLPDLMEEPNVPDDFIDSLLESVRFQRRLKNITAMRENGRVLVFNK
jgi:hypothetical protein